MKLSGLVSRVSEPTANQLRMEAVVCSETLAAIGSVIRLPARKDSDNQ